jgi:hypothetical protein
MNQKLNRIAELLKGLENWLCPLKSLEQELELRDVNVADNEGTGGIIETLEAALASAEQEVRRCELLFGESLPDEYISWLAALPSSLEFLWKARARS